jgi:predicted amidohydrolase
VIAGLVESIGGKSYSTASLFGPDGRLLGRQRKVHVVFNVESFNPGNEYSVFETDFGRIGMLLCFDGWACPDGLFHLAAQRMDLFFNPCLMFKKKPQRRMALLTHVLEYKLPIIAANNAWWALKVYPQDPDRAPEGGGSLIIAPPPFSSREEIHTFLEKSASCEEWIVHEAGPDEEILTATFDLQALRHMREMWDDCLGACIAL